MPVVEERRRLTGEAPSDMLQSFLEARYADGTGLADELIPGMVIWVMFAGFGLQVCTVDYSLVRPDGTRQGLDRFAVLGVEEWRDGPRSLWRVPSGEAAARIRLERSTGGAPPLEEARAAAESGGMAERHALALAEALAGNHEAAIELLLELVAFDKDWNEQAARKTLLEVFQLAGDDSELVDSARRRLAMLLY